MVKIPLSERLKEKKPLLGDGAMGTALHLRGSLSIQTCFDELNLTQPELVRSVHRDYIDAGAELIETNTFGANRFKLGEYGLARQVEAINRAGVELVRDAITESGRDGLYILGSIGPLGIGIKPYGVISRQEAQTAFRAQMTALVDAGVDALILETFADHEELLAALEVARDVSGDIPVIAQATFASDDLTLSGFAPARLADKLHKSGADIIGVNCGGGPSHLSRILNAMTQAVPDAYFSVMPNAGYPETVGGRAMYPATADYFRDYALTFEAQGATIIGGCCGTTPEHIRAMRQSLDNPAKVLPVVQVIDLKGELAPKEPERPTELAERLANRQFTITVEMTPPRSFTAKTLQNWARLMREAGADVLNVVDTPAAKMKMSAWAVCHLLQTRIGVETVLHFPTRGRNLLRVQGDLLAAHAMNLRNLFVVMGDPTRIGDYPDAMDTYDIVPSKLIALIKHQMNKGQDMAGNSIGKPTSFNVGCAINMAADNVDREIRTIQKKLEAGADFALGQAVFDPHRIETFIKRYREVTGEEWKLPVLMGVFPLYGVRQASYLHNEVPGVIIPDTIFKRLDAAGDDAPREGVKIAQELIRDMNGMIQGVYVMPAHGHYELAAEVVDMAASMATKAQ